VGLRYLVIAVFVSAGLFAYSKHEAVFDAFHFDPEVESIAVPSFDPAAKAQSIITPPEAVEQIRVVRPEDTRKVAVAATGESPGSPPVELTGGTSTVSGVVSSTSGPVPGASVLVERFVGESSAAVELTTDATGSFALPSAPGGRYRLRAWRSPDLAQLSSTVGFVADGEKTRFALPVSSQGGASVNWDYSGSGWMVGSNPSIWISVTQPQVTRQGQVVLAGAAGLSVSLDVGGALSGSASGVTNADGDISFGLTCASVGSTSATVRVGTYVQSLGIPACAPLPTTTTAPPTTMAPSTTTVPGTPAAPSSAPPPPSAPAPSTSGN